MNIAIHNLEPYYVNIALEKIRMYHEKRGDNVVNWDPSAHITGETFDKIYASSIFTWSGKDLVHPKAITGGSGYDITLQLPPRIEAMRPKINIGFTTRGCIRDCPACIVQQKEGPLRIVGDIFDFWDTKSQQLTLLDNNILADKDHFIKICTQLYKNRIIIDFNQGLDCRLLDKDIVKWLKKIRHTYYRFAFDDIGIENQVRKSIKLLAKHGIRHSSWYVLVGYNSTFKEDLYRCKLLKRLGQRVYIQRYNNRKDISLLMALSRWGNFHHIFASITFKEFLARPDNKFYLRTLFKKEVTTMAPPTEAEKERARKAKNSLVTSLQTMDVYSKFGVICEIQGVKKREGLREAVKDYIEKYSK